MKEWLTAAEIAREALPEMPASKAGVLHYAERLGWPESLAYARKRAGRGGGVEFHVALLPTSARIAYETRHRRVGTAVAVAEPAAVGAVATGISPTTRAGREAAARLAILAAYESFCRGARLGQASSALIFADKYNARTVAIEPWVVETVARISPRTLARWRAVAKAGRADKLAVKRDHRKGLGILETAHDGAVKHFILALITKNPMLTGAHLRDLCRDEFGDMLPATRGGEAVHLPMPSIRSFQVQVAAWKDEQRVLLAQISHPDHYRSHYQAAGSNAFSWVLAPNTLWQIDASPVDAMCSDGRYSVYACLDIASRRLILLLSRTPRAAAVALLIRKAILAWGVPAEIVTDNGSDFVAADTQRLLAVLAINRRATAAYTPQAKGHVERAIRTFQHDAARLMPGFVGHSVADRKRIEGRKGFAERLGADDESLFEVAWTGPEMQRRCDDWAAVSYAHRPHEGLGGRTPAQVAAAAEAEIRRVEPQVLDVLLMPVAGIRKASKQGIQVDNFHYLNPAIFAGDRVFVRCDPMDRGRILCFSEDQETFLGEAICPEAAGLPAAAFVRAHQEAQAELLAAKRRELAEARRRISKGPELLDRVIAVAKRDLAAAESNVVQLPVPPRAVAHATREIAAAADAAGVAAEPMEPARLTIEAVAVTAEPAEPPALPPGARPAFADDVTYAAWLVAHPDEVRDHDRAHLKDRLRSWAFRQLLVGAGVDADAVQALISNTKVTA